MKEKNRTNKQERKHSEIYLVLLLLLFISVGFAILTTTLNITGNTTLKANTWDVDFGNAGEATETPEVKENGEIVSAGDGKVDFTADLKLPGDYYEFEIPLKNEGSIAAQISKVTDVSFTEDQKKYLTHSVTWKETKAAVKVNDAIKASSQATIVVKVQFRPDVDLDGLTALGESGTKTVASTYGLEFVQATEAAKYVEAE